jgi:hypothetical protein
VKRARDAAFREMVKRPRGAELLGLLLSLGEAARRLGAEYKDVEIERHEPKRSYDAVVYLRPLVRAEFDRYSAVIVEHTQGATEDEEISDAPIGLRRSTGAMLIGVEATTADAAAARVLSLVRSCLQEAQVRVECDLQLEVRPTDERKGAPAS